MTTDLGGSAIAPTTLTVNPAPPAGAVGASINSGQQFTNDPHVSVALVWPAHISTVTISNDGGFAAAQTFPVNASIPWTLDASGPERLPKTIYVRFDDSTQTFQDDIILDQTPPIVEEVSVAPADDSSVARSSALPRFRLSIDASDNVSGVAQMQLASKRTSPGPLTDFTERRVLRGTLPLHVRVKDFAGNVSRWASAAATFAGDKAHVRLTGTGGSPKTVRSRSDGIARFRLKNNNPFALSGTLSLRTRAASVSAEQHRVNLGRKRFAVEAGRKRAIRVKLTKQARQRLADVGELRIVARLVLKSVDDRLVARRKFLLKAPKR